MNLSSSLEGTKFQGRPIQISCKKNISFSYSPNIHAATVRLHTSKFLVPLSTLLNLNSLGPPTLQIGYPPRKINSVTATRELASFKP